MSSLRALITLLTDFGSRDSYAGVLRGVIAGICPEAAVVDVTHEVPPQDIRAGAFHLLVACPYFPAGSVHLAVVDPGVGSDRRLIAVEAGGHFFVGPDNGLLRWVAERLAGDSWRAVELTEPRYWLAPASEVSHTFHGRDIMAPVAAHLAAGVRLERLGSPVGALEGTPLPRPVRDGERLRGEILHVDHFGNAITNIRRAHVSEPGGALRVDIGSHSVWGPVESYVGVGVSEPLVIWGSAGFLEVAVREGSAAGALGIGRDDAVLVRGGRPHLMTGQSRTDSARCGAPLARHPAPSPPCREGESA